MSATSDKTDPRHYCEDWPDRPQSLGRVTLVGMESAQLLTLIDSLNDWIEYLEMEAESTAARKSNIKSDYEAACEAALLKSTKTSEGMRKADARTQPECEALRVRLKELTSENAIRQAQLNNAKNRKDAAFALYWGKKNGMVD